MDTLIQKIDNVHQKEILKKLKTSCEDSQIYLSRFARCDDPKKKNVIGTVILQGTYNNVKQKRETYSVNIYNSGKNTFWCSCPYHKFKSGKDNTVCKHVAFLACKVARDYDDTFFNTKVMRDETVARLVEKLEGKEIWSTNIVKKCLLLTDFKQSSKVIDDVCPICYDDMEQGTTLVCPCCQNHSHEACMSVWLEQHDTCVYCRSDVWTHYMEITRRR